MKRIVIKKSIKPDLKQKRKKPNSSVTVRIDSREKDRITTIKLQKTYK